MKTLTKTALGVALILAPAPAFAQAAAATVPDAFGPPAVRPAPTPAQPAAEAPDVARSEEALRQVIADAQGTGFDYSVFTDNLAAQVRQQAPRLTPLLKGYGEVRSVEFERAEGEAHLFRVVFDNQATEWMIGFAPDDRIAALLFRPVEE